MAGKKGRSGRKKLEACPKGHDLTDPKNVRLVKRKDKIERQCLPCARKRTREHWRKKNGYYDKRDNETI